MLTLLNFAYFVPDDDLKTGDCIVVLLVPQQLIVGTRIKLEEKRANLDGMDCANVQGRFTLGNIKYVADLRMPSFRNRYRKNQLQDFVKLFSRTDPAKIRSLIPVALNKLTKSKRIKYEKR